MRARRGKEDAHAAPSKPEGGTVIAIAARTACGAAPASRHMASWN